ncbi:MAG: CPBP family glutamic-type intramembrane protease [Pseudolysinimonas sp.]
MTPLLVDADQLFRRPFRRSQGFTVRTGVLLLVVFGLARVALVLQANVTASYQLVSVVFVAMALLPWVLLSRSGRRRIGLVKPTRWRWIPAAVLAGVLACGVAYAAFLAIWGDSTSNPFVYIARSYSNVPTSMTLDDRLIYFAIYAAVGMTFSPIGEELLYRGIAHESLATSLGNRTAALIDAAAFALVHLAHFGIVYVAGVWSFLAVPATVWVGAMFFSALMFFGFRALTGSLAGAIAAHASFNLALNAIIFFLVLR